MEIMEHVPRVPMPAQSNPDNIQQKGILVAMLLSDEDRDKTREAKEDSYSEPLLERLEGLHTLQQASNASEHGSFTIRIGKEIINAEKLS